VMMGRWLFALTMARTIRRRFEAPAIDCATRGLRVPGSPSAGSSRFGGWPGAGLQAMPRVLDVTKKTPRASFGEAEARAQLRHTPLGTVAPLTLLPLLGRTRLRSIWRLDSCRWTFGSTRARAPTVPARELQGGHVGRPGNASTIAPWLASARGEIEPLPSRNTARCPTDPWPQWQSDMTGRRQ